MENKLKTSSHHLRCVSFQTSLIVCAWVLKFVLLTVHDYNLSPVVLSSGYFTEKRNAEAELLSKYITPVNQ